MLQTIIGGLVVSVIVAAGALAFKNPQQYRRLVNLIFNICFGGIVLYGVFVVGIAVGAEAIRKSDDPAMFLPSDAIPFNAYMPVFVLFGTMVAAMLVDVLRRYITSD